MIFYPFQFLYFSFILKVFLISVMLSIREHPFDRRHHFVITFRKNKFQQNILEVIMKDIEQIKHG